MNWLIDLIARIFADLKAQEEAQPVVGNRALNRGNTGNRVIRVGSSKRGRGV